MIQWWLPGARFGGVDGLGNYCLVGLEFPFGKMEKVVEMNVGDG